MTFPTQELPAAKIAAAVKAGKVSAREAVEAALMRIVALNDRLGAFTDVTAGRALRRADSIAAARARGPALGPLAGAPVPGQEPFPRARPPHPPGPEAHRRPPPAPTHPPPVATR